MTSILFSAATALPTRPLPTHSLSLCSRSLHRAASGTASNKAPPGSILGARGMQTRSPVSHHFMHSGRQSQSGLSYCTLAARQTLAVNMACHTGRVLIQQRAVRSHSRPYQHTAAQQGGPDISRLDPDLQMQWDHAANAHLGKINFRPHSHQQVGWLCDQCPDGHLHSWSARVFHRTDGNGCPQCCGQKVCKRNCLATKDPAVATQWDYEASSGTPESVVAQSDQPVGWLCDACGHKWSAKVSARVSKSKSGCPQCAKSARTAKRVTHPTIAEDPVLLAQWDHKHNADQGHFPDKIRLKSHKQIFWLCHKCPAGQEHSWPAPPFSRTSGRKPGCPLCAGQAACKCNSLQALYPSIAAEWDHGKDKGQPSDYTAGSIYMAWWSSPQRGSWQQTIHTRVMSVKRKAAISKHAQEAELC